MFKNVYYDRYKNTMHLWYQKKGKNLYKTQEWSPFLYLPSANGKTKTIDNKNVAKKTFSSYHEYQQYQKDNEGIYENNVIPEIQYLTEKYHLFTDDVLPQLDVYALDIEVVSDEFPDPKIAKYPITLISLYNFTNNKIHTFGLHEYTGDYLGEDVEYHYCNTEKELLETYLTFMKQINVDVLTGWNIVPNKKMNISGFDMLYIVNRMKTILPKNTYKQLSPINKVTLNELDNGNVNVDIKGISIIDYMTAYKWYSRNNPESYSLDFISNLELGVGKLEYAEYNTLTQLYENDWNTYVNYNLIDVKRIKELEDKLGYIKLVQSICSLTCCPMKYFLNMTSLIEGEMLVHYRKNKLCAPKMLKLERMDYSGGYVKQPQQGLHKWMFSIDISSSYPTHMVILNQSLETYVGLIKDFSNEEVVRYTSKRKFPSFTLSNFNTKLETVFTGNKLDRFNMMLDRGMICIAPNGTVFKTNPIGVIAQVQAMMFKKRKEVKRNMKQEKDQTKLRQMDSTQQAIKILLNSFYGILAFTLAPNRYINLHVSDAITSCGRHTIQFGEIIVNDVMNDPNQELNSILEELR